jgi:hypothetical protein
MPINLHRWCAENAASFHEMEQIEMALYPSPEDRDVALVQWVVRCLGNPANNDGGDVLEAVLDNRRAAA